MAASSVKIFDISDVGPVETTGGDVTNLQEAAEKGLGTFLEAVGVGLSSRYLKKLVDAGKMRARRYMPLRACKQAMR